MSDRPSYPWSEGDALFATELNAAIADAGTSSQPFSSLVIGDGTGAPTLTINGAAGTQEGIRLEENGTLRFQLSLNADHLLHLYGYNTDGGYAGQALQIDTANRKLWTEYQIDSFISSAPPAGGAVAGVNLSVHNTGANAAYGTKVEYYSTAGDAGFDIALGIVTQFDPVFQAGISPPHNGIWMMVVSPNEQTHPWGGCVGELNYVNRGPDPGFRRDRTFAGNNTGGLLFVPEASGGGSEGRHVGYGFAVSRSGGSTSTGFPCKTYIGFNAEPNSVVGLTGRAIYTTGDITGVASQRPYGPFQTDGTWLHGIDHTLAVYADANATTMLAGQGVAWLTGTTGTPTNICRDTAGTGSPEGVVTANKGSTYRRFDGAAGTCFYVKESGTGNTGWVAK